MKLNDLNIFQKVCETGGMTQATGPTGVSQPGISRIIREIETEVGAQLFRRTGRGVELTPAGEAFSDFVRSTLDGYRDIQQQIQQLATLFPSEMAIGVPLRTGRFIIPPVLKQFSREIPEVNVLVYEESTARLASGLQTGHYDMALLYDTTLSLPYSENLFYESLYLAGLPGLIGSEPEPVTMEQVSELPLLLPGKSTPYRKFIESAFRSRDRTLNIARELESTEAVLALAMEGDGVAILAYSNLYREHQAGEVNVRKIVDDEIIRPLHLAVAAHTSHRLFNRASRIMKRCLTGLADQVRWRPS